jgi:hypothetical protein
MFPLKQPLKIIRQVLNDGKELRKSHSAFQKRRKTRAFYSRKIVLRTYFWVPNARVFEKRMKQALARDDFSGLVSGQVTL